MRMPMNDLRSYMGAPQNSRRSEHMHMSSMESGMPTDRPYPGESYEAFMARMAAEGQGPAPVIDPRAAALAQMMGNPATNPANTYNMGRTTENFYDQPTGVDPQVVAGNHMELAGRLMGDSPISRFDTEYGNEPVPPDMPNQFGIYGNRARGNQPVEEMMTYDPSFGGDGSMLDAYGPGADSYAGVREVPGPEASLMQRRNRAVMGDPDPLFDQGSYPYDPATGLGRPNHSVDDFEDDNDETPASRFKTQRIDEGERIGPDGDGPKVNDTDNDSEPDGDTDDTEGELNMVQEQIGKAGQTSDELTGDEQGDADYLDSVATDVFAGYREQEELDRLIRRFKSKYGYTPELTGQEDSERDNAD